LLLILVMIFYPGGVAQIYNSIRDRIGQRGERDEPAAAGAD
jgi:hypothetical protein